MHNKKLMVGQKVFSENTVAKVVMILQARMVLSYKKQDEST